MIFIALTVVPLSHKKKETKHYYVDLVNPAVVRIPEPPPRIEKKVIEKKEKVTKKKAVTEKKTVETKPVETKPKKTYDLKDLEKKLNDFKSKNEEKEKKKTALEDKLAEMKRRQQEAQEKEEEVEEAAEETTEAQALPSQYAGMGDMDARRFYESLIRERVMAKFQLLKGFDYEGLEAKYDIKVDEGWRIISFKIVEPSEDRKFNEAAWKALFETQKETKTAPLPAPPEWMEREVLEEGIEFKFYITEGE